MLLIIIDLFTFSLGSTRITKEGVSLWCG